MENYSEQFILSDNFPDSDEKKNIRKYYFRISWIIVVFLLVFVVINKLLMTAASAIMGGGFTAECIANGKKLFSADPLLSSIYSYGFPIAADIIAISLGVLITKCDLKSKLRLNNSNGKDFLKYSALSFGYSTIGSFINLTLLIIVMLIIYGFSGFDLNNTLQAANIAPSDMPLWLEILIYIYICLLGPVLEELLFRGVFLDALKKYGNAFGIIMSSILFGLMHQNFTQCLPAMIMGFFFAAVTLKSGSLIPAIIIHIINNTLSSILMVLLQSIDMSDMRSLLNMSAALITAVSLNMILRVVCIIVAIILTVRFISSRQRFVRTTDYSKKRTWSYIFTSAPWLAAIIFMAYRTVTSIII